MYCAAGQSGIQLLIHTALGGQQLVKGSCGQLGLSGSAALVPQPLGTARQMERSSLQPLLSLQLEQ
jgi:hypothetical protein